MLTVPRSVSRWVPSSCQQARWRSECWRMNCWQVSRQHLQPAFTCGLLAPHRSTDKFDTARYSETFGPVWHMGFDSRIGTLLLKFETQVVLEAKFSLHPPRRGQKSGSATQQRCWEQVGIQCDLPKDTSRVDARHHRYLILWPVSLTTVSALAEMLTFDSWGEKSLLEPKDFEACLF